MHPEPEETLTVKTGLRNVLSGEFKGAEIEVVTGYDVSHDDWPFHVYVTPAGGRTTCLAQMPTQYRAHTMQDAFDRGMELAKQHLTPQPSGFQREVKMR